MSEIALAAAIRPKSKGSSTIGMKKSVVAIRQEPSSSCQTAASSLVFVPTRRRANGPPKGWSARSACSTEGASLQPHPPPCASALRRTGAGELVPSSRISRNLSRQTAASVDVIEYLHQAATAADVIEYLNVPGSRQSSRTDATSASGYIRKAAFGPGPGNAKSF